MSAPLLKHLLRLPFWNPKSSAAVLTSQFSSFGNAASDCGTSSRGSHQGNTNAEPQQKPQSAPKMDKLEGLKFQLPSSPFAAKRGPPVPRVVLYRGKGMLWFRFFVRMKVFQLAGVMTAGVLVSTVMAQDPNLTDIAAAGALALGCLVTSYCVWYYSGRYVGELSLLLPEKNTVRFSVLDFWGNRQDNDVLLASLDPPFRNRSVAEVKAMVRPALMPINVPGDRQYYISVGHGHILQKEVLLNIMYGSHPDTVRPQAPAEPANQPQQQEGQQPESAQSTAASEQGSGGSTGAQPAHKGPAERAP